MLEISLIEGENVRREKMQISNYNTRDKSIRFKEKYKEYSI